MTMAPEEFYYVVEFLLVVAVLIWFFAHPWQAFCIDVSRHRHFELRNRLFMLAVNGRIAFDDPLYRALREWLNNRIRLAHVNLFGDIVATLIAHGGVVPKVKTLGDEIDQMDDGELRAELRSIYFQAIEIQIAHMVVRSPFFLVLLAVFSPIVFLIDLIDDSVRAMIRWVTDLAQVVDDRALRATEP